jgi:hypothetical protein
MRVSAQEENRMRFYNRQHRHYCGIDLHVKTMYICILDSAGQVLVHRNVRHIKDGKKIVAGIEKNHGKGKALSILAHTIGRAVFYRLSRGTVFSMEKCLAA